MKERLERIEQLTQEKTRLLAEPYPHNKAALRKVNRELHREAYGQAPAEKRAEYLHTLGIS